MSPSPRSTPRSSRRHRSISIGGSSTELPPPMSARCHAVALGIQNMNLASDSHLANTSPMNLSPRSSRRRWTISTRGSSADTLPPLVVAALRIRNMHLSSDSHLANTSRMSLSPRSRGRCRSISTRESSAEAPRLSPPQPAPPRRSVRRSPECLAAALENMQLASDFHLQPGSILQGGKSIVSDLFNNNPSGMTGPHLIIAPHMVLMVWLDEFLTWFPSFTTILYYGKPEERKTIRDRFFGDGKFNVLLISLERMVEDKKFLSKLSWGYLIFDQGERQLSNQMRTYVDNIMKAFDYKCSFFVQNLVP